MRPDIAALEAELDAERRRARTWKRLAARLACARKRSAAGWREGVRLAFYQQECEAGRRWRDALRNRLERADGLLRERWDAGPTEGDGWHARVGRHLEERP